jgi:hypothetical protein
MLAVIAELNGDKGDILDDISLDPARRRFGGGIDGLPPLQGEAKGLLNAQMGLLGALGSELWLGTCAGK